MADRRKVLITGAAGRIGTALRKAWTGKYDLVLTDSRAIPDPDGADVFIADIRGLELMRKAMEGVDTVVHLAANASAQADFETQVLPMNIIGTHQVFQAAADAGVKRIIFASSIHAVGAYPPDVQVHWDTPVRPCCEYGAGKCYGEALGRYFSDRYGLSFIAVRIGGFHHDDAPGHHDPRSIDLMVSDEDLTQLMTKAVDAPESLKWTIVHALSDSAFKRLDISHTREILGYNPQDQVEAEDEEIQDPMPLAH